MSELATNVKLEAADRRQGMTLDELGVFVQQALKAGVPGGTSVRADVSAGRQLVRRIETR